MGEEGVVQGGGEGDGENVCGNVFEGEVSAEEDLACEREAEGIDGGDGDEAAEFDQGGDRDGERGQRLWAKFGE